MPRILLIDDHAAHRRGEFGRAPDPQQTLELLPGRKCHAALLDLNLPARGGLDLTRSLKNEQPDLAILVYSVHAENQFGRRAMRAAADGYLTADQRPELVGTALHTILGGSRYLSSDLAALMNSLQGTEQGRHHLLSLQVHRLLASGKSNADLVRYAMGNGLLN